jgi:hypothetical protein
MSGIANFYGFTTNTVFKNQMNKKMSGGQTMYSPPSSIGRINHVHFNVGNRVNMSAPSAVGTIPSGSYPVFSLSKLTNTLK